MASGGYEPGPAGLPYPEGDPAALRDAARSIGAAASAVSITGYMVGWSSANAASWEGDAASRFRGAVSAAQTEMTGGSGALEQAAGALEKLATQIEDAQEEINDLAAKVEEAEREADEAEARAALADIATAGAATALGAFGPDPPAGLVRAKEAAEDAATTANKSAVGARERATEVRRRAVRRARELCEDCERLDRTIASVIDDAAATAPRGSGSAELPGARYASRVARRMTVSDLKELAFLRAGIDPNAWDPRSGLDANDAAVRAVYAYYRELALERGELQWAKLAAVGGPLFYAGFKDLDAAGDLSPLSGDELGFLPDGWGLGSDELRAQEGNVLTIQKAIFSDLAWQHEAYLLGGPAAIRRAVNKLPAGQRRQAMDPRTMRAWEDIASGDLARVEGGNFRLVEREQLPVVQRYYDRMLDRSSGPAFTEELTQNAGSPFPDGETYEEYSERVHGDTKGNIALYADRIRFIRESIWPDHQELLRRPGGVERMLARDFDEQAEDFRQLEPKKLAPPLIPPIRPPVLP